MRLIINNVYQSTVDAGSMTITRAVSDPVPTCSFSLTDNTSSIFPQAMQEVLIVDDQRVPNPTANMLQNPSLTSPNLSYGIIGTNGVAVAGLNPGYLFQLSNNAVGQFYYRQNASAMVGQTYVFSLSFNINPSFVNGSAFIGMVFCDAGGNVLPANQQFYTTTTPVNTLTRISVQSTAPTGASYVQIQFGVNVTNATNSGSVAFYQLQLEPLWFPTLSYPTLWCGPSQTNCQQLPSGLWIRQYRKFAGFVNHVTYGDYKGNVRTVQVNAVGYAWLMSLVICNNSYTSQADSAIISNLLSTYFPGLFTTTNVVTGVTLSNFGSNWDDVRTLFDNLASQIGFYWTVDSYWNVIYAPPGYFNMPISLICDNSSTPDMVTTYPAYDFSAEMDYTQPGSTALVIGSGTNVAEVIDPYTVAQNSYTAGYSFKVGSTFMRKINDSTLQSVSDCTQRGMAEILQYDYPRGIYHLTTNVELIPGQSIQITSNTDNLNQSTQLIQQVTATWLGVNELLQDQWEYKADLGAVNRASTNIISRLARKLNSNTSAPAISQTALVVFERLGLTDGLPSSYAQSVLLDHPQAYYRLGESSGTVAYDWSGNNYSGTISGTVAYGQSGAIPGDINTCMLFDGTSGEVTLPSINLSTWTSITLECWAQVSPGGFTNFPRLIANDYPASSNRGIELVIAPSSDGHFGFFDIGLGTTYTGFGFGSGTPTPGQWYHLAAVYDGSAQTMTVYVNGAVAGSLTGITGVNFTSTHALMIAADAAAGGQQFGGFIDEIAIYNYALPATRVQAHAFYRRH